MKRAMAWAMTGLGLSGLLGIPALVTYGLGLGCGFGAAAGCSTSLGRLWWRFLTGPDVVLFLVPMAAAAVAFGFGLRLHRQVSAHRFRAGTGGPRRR
ncbi:MAG: hypothetical protein ACK41U_14020 [Paracoccus sp. (in: a-proteobacteria)]|uniref:hypothetical protein n=1 Tax=Paracoccus sp. TaxID=267 RepID=UPI00391E0372